MLGFYYKWDGEQLEGFSRRVSGYCFEKTTLVAVGERIAGEVSGCWRKEAPEGLDWRKVAMEVERNNCVLQ